MSLLLENHSCTLKLVATEETTTEAVTAETTGVLLKLAVMEEMMTEDAMVEMMDAIDAL